MEPKCRWFSSIKHSKVLLLTNCSISTKQKEKRKTKHKWMLTLMMRAALVALATGRELSLQTRKFCVASIFGRTRSCTWSFCWVLLFHWIVCFHSTFWLLLFSLTLQMKWKRAERDTVRIAAATQNAIAKRNNIKYKVETKIFAYKFRVLPLTHTLASRGLILIGCHAKFSFEPKIKRTTRNTHAKR